MTDICPTWSVPIWLLFHSVHFVHSFVFYFFRFCCFSTTLLLFVIPIFHFLFPTPTFSQRELDTYLIGSSAYYRRNSSKWPKWKLTCAKITSSAKFTRLHVENIRDFKENAKLDQHSEIHFYFWSMMLNAWTYCRSKYPFFISSRQFLFPFFSNHGFSWRSIIRSRSSIAIEYSWEKLRILNLRYQHTFFR